MPPIRALNNRYEIDEECYISFVHASKPTALHTHDFLEITYIFKGHSIQVVDGVEYPVKAGDALFINYGSTHAIEAVGDLIYADIIIKPEYISESLKGVENAFALLELDGFKEFAKIVDRNDRMMHFSEPQRKQIEGLIMLAQAEQDAERPGKELMLRSVFNALLTLVFRKMALPMRKESGIGAELLEYIKLHCVEPLTMEEIARTNYYNPAYFSRLFKKQTGYTFTEYLTACRIDLACRLLKETELKVSDIAAESGFSDRTKFYKVFSEKMGMTPKHYRKSKT
ncbi:MAG: helix-turn-helix domain-containing protein [Ruminococcaceae bacterium]|nr:helix-turn-helix domain-containing protein [Oscillospiraceae bacterium]